MDNTNDLVYGKAQLWSRCMSKGAVWLSCHNIQFEPSRQTALSSYCHGEQCLWDLKHKGWRKVSLKSCLRIELDICVVEELPQRKASCSVSAFRIKNKFYVSLINKPTNHYNNHNNKNNRVEANLSMWCRPVFTRYCTTKTQKIGLQLFERG